MLDPVEAFGTVAVTAMVVFYALESRNARYVLLFAGACAASGTYAAIIGAWPFAVVESIWALVAVRRWRKGKTGFSLRSNPHRVLGKMVRDSLTREPTRS